MGAMSIGFVDECLFGSVEGPDRRLPFASTVAAGWRIY
jgi:hypothetical protein